MKKVIVILLSVTVLLCGIYFIVPGFDKREDVVLYDFALSEDGSQMTLYIGVTGSAGYIRKVKNISEKNETADLNFYSAFGGINGSIGKRESFVIDLTDECREIRFNSGEEFNRVLFKNESGQWEKV